VAATVETAAETQKSARRAFQLSRDITKAEDYTTSVCTVTAIK
jgi:hypothetical protein